MSAASRRSSSAPTNHYPSLRDGATVTSVGQSTTEKTNAETQTAIRGVAIMESGCGHAPSGSVSAVAEETLFFTECESCKQTKTTSKQTAARLTPPVTTKTTTTTQQNLSSSRQQNQNQNNQFHEKFEKRKQFSSTPNVAASTTTTSSNNNIARTSRKETLPKRNQTRPSVRKHSLSPTRQYSELPGSPDNQLDIQEKTDRKRTKRSNTVVSPIHNRKM